MSAADRGAARGSVVREALQKLAGESLVYGLGQAGGRAVQLLLVPVLTRLLDPGAFGVSELVLAYSQTAIVVLVFGMDGALARFFYHEPDRAARIRMASSSLALRLATGIAAAILLWTFAGPLAAHLATGAVYRKYFRIGAATIPLTLVVLFMPGGIAQATRLLHMRVRRVPAARDQASGR